MSTLNKRNIRSLSSMKYNNEGKCGNEFTFHPRGKESSAVQVTCSVNGKKSPTLEADETYVNEQEKLEDSQSGNIEITVDGNSAIIIEDLEVLKKKITRHKDIKIDITMFDRDVLAPTQLLEFRSPANHVTMTPKELLTSQIVHQEYAQFANSMLETFGIKDEDQIVVMEAPSLDGDNIVKKSVLDIESEDVSWEQKKKIVHDVLSTVRLDGTILPSALATGDLLSGTEKKIILDAIRGLKNNGWNGKFYVNINKAGNTEIIFKGWAHFRKHLNFTHILVTNAKVSALGASAELSKLSGKGFANAANPFKSAPFGILVVGTLDVVEWYTSEKPWQDNYSDLFVALGIDTVKFGIATVSGIVIGAAVIAIFGVSATVGLVIVSILVGGVAMSYGLEWIDSEFGVTQSAKDRVNEVENYIEKNYEAPQEYRSGVPSWLLR